jgi:hypothetical protein
LCEVKISSFCLEGRGRPGFVALVVEEARREESVDVKAREVEVDISLDFEDLGLAFWWCGKREAFDAMLGGE